MPEVTYPIAGCEYKTPDLDAPIVAALITAHSATHPPIAAAPVAAAKIERVQRPTISAAGTSTDWSYFQSRWKDYVDTTKVVGRDKVIQLLECCDEPHYANMSVQYTAIFHGCKNDNFQMKILIFFLLLLKT